MLFLRWLAPATRTARAIDPLRARTSPGWAVAWWFIPIFELFKPYGVMRELYVASASAGRERPATVPWSFPLRWLTRIAPGARNRQSISRDQTATLSRA